MLAIILASLVAASPSTHLTIQPWNGKDLLTTTTSAAKYRLHVTGKPKATIHLEASQVADGWIAAFCTPTVCAPTRVDVKLPSSGQAEFQFELIRELDTAVDHSGAVITTDDGATVSAPQATR